MVRNYVKKREKSYTPEDLASALDDIREGRMKQSHASVHYNIPRHTLVNHLKRTVEPPGSKLALPEDVEKRIAASLKIMHEHGFRLRSEEIIDQVEIFIEKNDISTIFRNKRPGSDWFTAFKNRHDVTIKRPIPPQHKDLKYIDPFYVQEYFDLLIKTIHENNLDDRPDRIWTLKEITLYIEPKIETNDENIKCNSERCTILLAASADGQKLPPLYVFKNQSIPENWIPDYMYPGSLFRTSNTGEITCDIIFEYLKCSMQPKIPSNSLPFIVIIDGNATHIDCEIIEWIQEEDITLISLPPGSSKYLYPLYKSIYSPLQVQYTTCLKTYGNNKLSLKDKIVGMLSKLWNELSAESMWTGFGSTGMHPISTNIVPNSAYHKNALERFKNKELGIPKAIIDPANKPPPRKRAKKITISCNICEEKYNSKISLKEHMEKHTIKDIKESQLLKKGVFSCRFCKLKINSPYIFHSNVIGHIVLCNGEQDKDTPTTSTSFLCETAFEEPSTSAQTEGSERPATANKSNAPRPSTSTATLTPIIYPDSSRVNPAAVISHDSGSIVDSSAVIGHPESTTTRREAEALQYEVPSFIATYKQNYLF